MFIDGKNLCLSSSIYAISLKGSLGKKNRGESKTAGIMLNKDASMLFATHLLCVAVDEVGIGDVEVMFDPSFGNIEVSKELHPRLSLGIPKVSLKQKQAISAASVHLPNVTATRFYGAFNGGRGIIKISRESAIKLARNIMAVWYHDGMLMDMIRITIHFSPDKFCNITVIRDIDKNHRIAS